MNRLLLAAFLAASALAVTACNTSPSTFTVHGTVTLTSLNGVPPQQAWSGYGGPSQINPQVNIVADDGPGNYSGPYDMDAA